jgi:hypothetical protein
MKNAPQGQAREAGHLPLATLLPCLTQFPDVSNCRVAQIRKKRVSSFGLKTWWPLWDLRRATSGPRSQAASLWKREQRTQVTLARAGQGLQLGLRPWTLAPAFGIWAVSTKWGALRSSLSLCFPETGLAGKCSLCPESRATNKRMGLSCKLGRTQQLLCLTPPCRSKADTSRSFVTASAFKHILLLCACFHTTSLCFFVFF